MITAVDSNVLLDILIDGAEHATASRRSFRACFEEGSVVACDVVVAEVGSRFTSSVATTAAFDVFGLRFDAIDLTASLAAAEAWRSYRRRGGKRERMLADFLIGAHAQTRADRLLTRDRGFYRTYFKRLRLIDPAKL